MAYGDHRPIFQYCGYQAGQYGGTHRGKKLAHLYLLYHYHFFISRQLLCLMIIMLFLSGYYSKRVSPEGMQSLCVLI